ncbi:MAG: response regulator transcription factor [Eubacterium sp.]
MYSILVADDEERIRRIIRKYAEFEGYEVTDAVDGSEAVSLCKIKEFDVVILDVMMPGMDGFNACREIKKIKDIPVIMLSARGEEYDRIHGFEVGVDDYVVKPFSPKELMMRIKVIISRNDKKKHVADEHDVFVYEGLEVDFTGRTVKVNGKKVNMTPKEYELMFYLVRNRGIALSREKLISDVWGYDYYGDDRTLDTHIKLLRSSIGPYRKLLITLRGVGYRFEA